MIEKEKLAAVKRGDIIIIVTTLALSLLLGVFVLLGGLRGSDGSAVRIETPDGVSSYSLSEDADFEVCSMGYTLSVRISSGKVSVCKSDCPDGLCEHMGEIFRVGESIVCVPARVKISVSGEREGDDDAVAG